MPLLASAPAPGRPYAGESLAERTARRRHQFLDAGLQMFGTTGYRSATVRQLCKQAELTDRYFYESFDSMEDLLVAVYEREFDQLQLAVMTALQSKAEQPDLSVAVSAGLQALFEMASDPKVARVCWLEVLGVSPRVDAVYIRVLDRFAQLVLTFAEQHVPDMTLPEDERRILSIALVGAVNQSVLRWMLDGYRDDAAKMVAVTSKVFMGVMRTLRPDAP
ncbi:MAG TPA: TetR/AcrR family transcriptional regulator [Aquabacterium sp.]|uniref:TetR/AcrR family transcriptional regulator n=1 Tax=Aquabacterium sp. TaxID=1872578 RepID=UPI002E3125DE|nr:TetR/AcrR family transcriptional regulator [Aquabacterium sp.]HEX5371586.1 TetR/AcrR family transcriptional regulator [Aquabacterium sp.]